MTVARLKPRRSQLLPAPSTPLRCWDRVVSFPALADCDGDTWNLLEGTLGFWYRFYDGPKGRMQFGGQYSYAQRNTWSGVNAAGDGVGPHG
jgi:hypothetical protein